MIVENHKWLVLLPLKPHPLQCDVRDKAGCMAVIIHIAIRGAHGWVVIRPLPVKKFIVIKPLRWLLIPKMPFPHRQCLITRLLKQYRKRSEERRVGKERSARVTQGKGKEKEE